MSRIGKQKIKVSAGVAVSIADGVVIVKGPKGELQKKLHKVVNVNITSDEVTVDVGDRDDKQSLSLWGTFASHIKNMVRGVSVGYEKKLEINGVGFKAAMKGTDINLEVGFTHPVLFTVPNGVVAKIEKNVITLTGFDKELVGQTAAKLREVKKPEPYKGKGIKYAGEVIRMKAGKAAKSAAA